MERETGMAYAFSICQTRFNQGTRWYVKREKIHAMFSLLFYDNSDLDATTHQGKRGNKSCVNPLHSEVFSDIPTNIYTYMLTLGHNVV